MGFTFNRSGQRVPAIAISAWIPARRVVTEEYRHTSLIRTMRERWSLGAPFTARDATARDIAPILSLDRPRTNDQWPDVTPRPVPPFNVAMFPPDAPLSVLGKAIFFAALAFEKMLGGKVPNVPHDTTITGAQALAIMRNTSYAVFPGLRDKA